MARINVIDGVVEQLRLTNGYEHGNTGTAVAYDYRVLSAGVDRAAIVFAGELQHARMVIGGKTEMTYALDVEVYTRHGNDVVAAYQDADRSVANIVQRINDNPTLGGSAFDAMVTRGEVIAEKVLRNGQPWLAELLTITAVEHLTNS